MANHSQGIAKRYVAAGRQHLPGEQGTSINPYKGTQTSDTAARTDPTNLVKVHLFCN